MNLSYFLHEKKVYAYEIWHSLSLLLALPVQHAEQGLYNGPVSVRLSVCASIRPSTVPSFDRSSCVRRVCC